MSARTGFNNLSIEIYSGFSTTAVEDPAGDLQNARIESFETIFPKGLFGMARLFIPRQVTDSFLFKGGNRVVIKNGSVVVYEGQLGKIGYRLEDGASQGITVECAGYWGALLGRRTWNKRWVDLRLTEDVWQWDTSATANAKDIVSADRQNRIRFTPNNEFFYDNQLAAVSYSMPTGETIKRVVLTRELQEKFLLNAAKVKHAVFYGYDTATSVKHAVFDGYALPTKVWSFTSPSTYADMTNAYDGNTGTSAAFTLASSGFIYIRYSKPFNKINMNLGPTFNTTTTTITVQVDDGDGYGNVSGLSDGTASGGKPFAQDGVISWTAPTAWAEDTVNGFRGYYARIRAGVSLTSVDFVEIEVEDTDTFTYTTLTNAFDNDTGTNVSATLGASDYLYVRYDKKFDGVKMNLGAAVNNNAATLAAQYYQDVHIVDGGEVAADWASVTISSDTTASGGATLAQDGNVLFTAPADWIETTVDGARGFWVRLKPSAALDAVNFVEVEPENETIYTYTDKDNTVDGDTSTNNTFTIITTDYLYVKTQNVDNFGLVKVTMSGTTNSVSSTLSGQYPTVDDEGIVTWNTLASLVDGTASGSATLAEGGDITFTPPGDIAEVSINGESGAWVRFSVSVNLTPSIGISEIQTGLTQEWELRLRDRTTPATIWSVTSSGSSAADSTLATPVQTLYLEFLSQHFPVQVGENNGTVYGQISGVEVYSETGSITLYEIARDIRAKVTDLNSDESNIDSVFFNPLTPFMTNGPEKMSSILERAASYGDAAYDQWSAYIRESDAAASPNGKPVLFLKEYLPLTDYDYAIKIHEENLLPTFEILQDFDNIINWVSIRYTDSITGREIFLTPDDDATLKDSASITTWGERHISQPLDGGVSNSTNASLYARRVLAASKDPKFYVNGPITVVGYIRTKAGNFVPASQIWAGKRIRIENFLEDKAYVTGAGLTFLITQTTYNDAAETCSMSTGIQDDLATFLAQKAMLDERRTL